MYKVSGNLISLLTIFTFLLTIAAPLLAQSRYTCLNTPIYTLGDDLYNFSPSSGMSMTHRIIGQLNVFSEYFSLDKPISSVLSSFVYEEIYVSGVRVQLIQPHILKNKSMIIYLHGGGYTHSITMFHWDYITDLAVRAGNPVYVVHYDTAPDKQFSHQLEQAVSVILDMITNNDVNNLVIIGDSAGGNLALTSLDRIRLTGIPLPEKTVLISPWLDLSSQNPDIHRYDLLDLMFSIDDIRLFTTNYLGNEYNKYVGKSDVSPIDIDNLSGLPPTLLITGTHEILYPETLLFKKKALDHGMDLTFIQVNGGFHDFNLTSPLLVPESEIAREQIASFINCK